ncbi:4'-phosphopantetheinyl transferase EntD [Streptomyces sp. KhCrAH-43]|uniref:4'-phosphopantetheinyl transferase family protein n=1 Tax=unclassified Streptomyces TaxID=2593676 RepID=UPI00036DB968|nr:4'-phosphopantetheinyl transferase superfamily protein [Streptomyces sp. KhCrAH-43]MYS39177.1 4'-phosphopantetheinyl transferase superfamily protein [Streptomyces sp. SID4920]MYX64222.1 4'-phosphopantetheinyl transferase superfamily protein [Streptomyces sp. SID8373]RAJ48734.1 4'-phosphopantetheinyl transferase EntD [Streptomyces sp. KhCrAH-43]
MIRTLLPAYAAGRETSRELTAPALFEAERAEVADALPARRAEYATVRRLARVCLADVGVPPAALLRDLHGAPRWPAGTVGSLTHCRGYRAAAAARSRDADGMGIDAEPCAPLPRRVLEGVTSAAERAHLAELRAHRPGVPWCRVLFSAKEAYYKVWYPAMGSWLGFDDAEVVLRPGRDRGTFTVRPVSGGARRVRRPDAAFDPAATGFPALSGRWTARAGLVVTAITAPAGSLPRRAQAGRTATGTLRCAQ